VKQLKSGQIKDEEAQKLEQLRLRQVMNLKAKGFFLDNADEICKMEF
jgi:hypothetical protein